MARALLVEDESIVAMVLEEQLAELGHTVSAEIESIENLEQAIIDGGFDFVILDLRIVGGSTVKIGERLCQQGVPAILSSGHIGDDLPEILYSIPHLTKPYQMSDIYRAIEQLTI